jgi:hypothetical protein
VFASVVWSSSCVYEEGGVVCLALRLREQRARCICAGRSQYFFLEEGRYGGLPNAYRWQN